MSKLIILCIDDEPTVINSLKIELKRALGDDYLIETAEGGEEALELINEILEEKGEVAVVLSDYIMPDIKGDELLRRIHFLCPQTLKIMLTGQADLDAVSNAIKYARLYRYIPKPWQPEDLKLTVIEAIHSYLQDKQVAQQKERIQQINQDLERLTIEQEQLIAERTKELENINQTLLRLAYIDELTQIANRRRLDEYLSQEWRRMKREKQPLSLILIDVDDFKRYNDSYGYLKGDECLKSVAQTISNVVKRPGDLVARYGGEEFIVIAPNTQLEGTVQLAEMIRLAIQELQISHCSFSSFPYVTVSLGVTSIIPAQDLSPELLITTANKALLKAKKQGKNRVISQIKE